MELPDHGMEAYVGLRIRTADRKITFKLAVLLCSFTSGRRDATPLDAQIVSTRRGSLQASWGLGYGMTLSVRLCQERWLQKASRNFLANIMFLLGRWLGKLGG